MNQEVNVAFGQASSPPPITQQFRLPLLCGGRKSQGISEVDVTFELDPMTVTVTSFRLQFHERTS